MSRISKILPLKFIKIDCIIFNVFMKQPLDVQGLCNDSIRRNKADLKENITYIFSNLEKNSSQIKVEKNKMLPIVDHPFLKI